MNPIDPKKVLAEIDAALEDANKVIDTTADQPIANALDRAHGYGAHSALCKLRGKVVEMMFDAALEEKRA